MQITAANIFVAQTGYRRAVIVEIETDAGISGIGEVGIAYGTGTQAAAAMAEEMLVRFVIGKDPSRIELIWNTIYDVSFWTKGGGAIAMAGLSGIEHALWDIKGKALGVPVFDQDGGGWGHLTVVAHEPATIERIRAGGGPSMGDSGCRLPRARAHK